MTLRGERSRDAHGQHQPILHAGSNPAPATTNEDTTYMEAYDVRGKKHVCPECGGSRLYKAGLRYLADGSSVQRWLCRSCGYRFSEGREPLQKNSDWHLKAQNAIGSSAQILRLEAKNLSSSTETKTVGDTRKISAEAQLVNYLIRLKNDGKSEATIEARDWQLKRLVNLGADLNNPESVKKTIAALDRTESYKLLLCIAYEGFLKANGLSWERPKYRQSEPLPFCPHESELDALIANCGKKTATLLRLLKETGMRLGEAWMTEWRDFDPANRTLMCRNPEKHSRPRMFDNLSPELCRMLQDMPHNSQFIFTCSRQPLDREDPKEHLKRLRRQKSLLGHQRRRTANKLKNPRIAMISYHSFRHWKATQLYHQTKDILYVMKFLGHRTLKNTLVYIDLERICYPNGGDDYIGRAARTETEALQLIEAGFEYVCTVGEAKLFRKRK